MAFESTSLRLDSRQFVDSPIWRNLSQKREIYPDTGKLSKRSSETDDNLGRNARPAQPHDQQISRKDTHVGKSECEVNQRRQEIGNLSRVEEKELVTKFQKTSQKLKELETSFHELSERHRVLVQEKSALETRHAQELMDLRRREMDSTNKAKRWKLSWKEVKDQLDFEKQRNEVLEKRAEDLLHAQELNVAAQENLENENKSLKSQILGLQKKCDGLEQKNSSLKGKLKKAKKAANQAQSERQRLESRSFVSEASAISEIDGLKREIRATGESFRDLKEQLRLDSQERNEAVQQMKTDIGGMRAHADQQLQFELNSARSDLRMAEFELSQLREKDERLEISHARKKSRLSAMKKEFGKVKAEVENLDQRVQANCIAIKSGTQEQTAEQVSVLKAALEKSQRTAKKAGKLCTKVNIELDKTKQMNQELMSHVNKQQTRISELISENTDLKQKMEEQQREIENKQDKAKKKQDDLKKEVQKMEKLVRERDFENQQLKSDLESQVQRTAQCERDVSEKRKEIEEMKLTLETEKQAAQQRIAQAEKEKDSLIKNNAKLQELLNEATQEKADLSSRLDAAKLKLSEMKQKKSALKSDGTAAKQRIGSLERENAQLQATIEERTQEKSRIEDQARQESETMKETLGQLETKVRQLETDIETLEKQKNLNEEQIQAKEKENRELAEQINDVQRLNHQQGAKIQELLMTKAKDPIPTQDTQTQTLIAEKQTESGLSMPVQNSDTQTLALEKVESEQQITELQENLRQASEEASRLRNQNTSLQKTCDEQQEKISLLQQQIASLEFQHKDTSKTSSVEPEKPHSPERFNHSSEVQVTIEPVDESETVRSLRNAVKKYEDEVASLASDKDQFTKEISNLTKSMYEAQRNLSVELANRDAEIARLKKHVSNQKQTLEEQARKLARANQVSDAELRLREQAQATQERLRELTHREARKDKKIKKLERKIKNLKEECEQQGDVIAKAEQQIQFSLNVARQYEAAKLENQRLQQELHDSETSFQEKLKASHMKIHEIEEQRKAIAQENDHLTLELRQCKDQCESLHNLVATLSRKEEKEVAKAQRRQKQTEGENKQLQEIIRDLKSQLNEDAKQLDEMERLISENRRVKKENQQLKDDVQAEKTVLSDKINDLEAKLQKGNTIIRSLMKESRDIKQENERLAELLSQRGLVEIPRLDEVNTVRENNEALERENVELRNSILQLSGCDGSELAADGNGIVAELTAANASLRRQVEDLEAKLASQGSSDSGTNYKAECSRLEKRLKEATNMNEKLNGLLENAHKRTHTLQEQLTALREQNLELTKKLQM